MARKVRKVGKRKLKPNRIIQAPNNEGASATKLREDQDTAIRLLQDLKHHRLDPKDISPSQRRACLLLIANGTQTTPEMAAVFKVSASTIRNDLKLIREELGRSVKEWSLEEVLGDLALASEKTAAMAMKQQDPGLAWTIRRDFAKLLKEFGVVGPRQERTSLTMIVEGIGEGYERAREQLSRALDPRLTGEVIETEGTVTSSPLSPPPLPLSRRINETLPEESRDDESSVDDDPDPSEERDDDDPRLAIHLRDEDD